MNTLHVKGNGNVAGKLKPKYAKLPDSDFQNAGGREDELIGRIQKRPGETREAVEQALNTCFADEL